MRTLCFQTDASGRTLTLAEIERRYGFAPDGVNAYYGICEATAGDWRKTGRALRADHRAVLDDLRDAPGRSGPTGRTLVLGLWPYQPPDPYGFVREHLGLVECLAGELNDYQKQARERGVGLDIVVRYASEMNDPATGSQPWGRRRSPDPEQQEWFRSTFRTVRGLFAARAPRVRFAFSPAIRRDTLARYEELTRYWPGEGLVDVISCTWYTGRRTDLGESVEAVRRYFRDRLVRNLPFGIDEIGGADGDSGNDAILKEMFQALAALASERVSLDYVSLFLKGRWGRDATLSFLKR